MVRLRASTRKACSQLKPVLRIRVWIVSVNRRYATIGQVEDCSLVHCSDSYCLVRSLIRWRIAIEALSAIRELHLLAMSVARNISERNVGKSRSFRVARCFGLIEMVPVVGSMTMFCRPESVPEIIMPFVVPGAAIYGSLLGSGVLFMTEMGENLLSSRHLRTRMSSWLKDHSSADRRVVVADGLGGAEVDEGEAAAELSWAE